MIHYLAVRREQVEGADPKIDHRVDPGRLYPGGPPLGGRGVSDASADGKGLYGGRKTPQAPVSQRVCQSLTRQTARGVPASGPLPARVGRVPGRHSSRRGTVRPPFTRLVDAQQPRSARLTLLRGDRSPGRVASPPGGPDERSRGRSRPRPVGKFSPAAPPRR